MRRMWVSAGLVLGLGWWLWPSLDEAPTQVRRLTSRAEPRPPPRREVQEAPEVEVAEEVQRRQAFEGRMAKISQACGLPLMPLCAEGRCAVLMEAPDLDQPLGWAQMLWRSPRFVASTAARDLGVPVSGLPCGAALDGLAGPTVSVERADGSELWCTGEVALCEAEALARFGVGGFLEQGARRLSFRVD